MAQRPFILYPRGRPAPPSRIAEAVGRYDTSGTSKRNSEHLDKLTRAIDGLKDIAEKPEPAKPSRPRGAYHRPRRGFTL
jgi:hypothetical protein